VHNKLLEGSPKAHRVTLVKAQSVSAVAMVLTEPIMPLHTGAAGRHRGQPAAPAHAHARLHRRLLGRALGRHRGVVVAAAGVQVPTFEPHCPGPRQRSSDPVLRLTWVCRAQLSSVMVCLPADCEHCAGVMLQKGMRGLHP